MTAPFPVVVSPISGTHGAQDLLAWAACHHDIIAAALCEQGGVVMRGFRTPDGNTAQQLLDVLGAEPVQNVFWSTPRTRVGSSTFTATEYPARQWISPHSELSYHKRFPRLLVFHAMVCAAQGGETTVFDLDAVSAELGEMSDEFHQRGVTYVRTFHPGIDIPMSAAFGTEDHEAISNELDALGMAMDSIEGVPRITHTAQGALTDSETGARIWFNQANLYHPAGLTARTRDFLIGRYADALPRQARFGDDTPIPDAAIVRVQSAFARHAEQIEWLPGDVAVIDNLRRAHGRAPFVGQRVLHVAMGMPVENAERPSLRRIWAN